ncbi:MAG: HDOD domain-containing protein [Myxococcales bacterium]|nr:HDOD domain-containing protein [Myxococcales bacterium]
MLVADDDPELLASTAMRARRHRHRWQLTTALGGQAAIDRLTDEPFDLLITDLSMPRVGGGQVLSAAKELRPSMVRFVLSGRADRSMAKDGSTAHQVFAKPSDLDELLKRADLALDARRLLSPEEVALVTSGAIVPPSPKIFAALHAALNLADYEPRFVAKIVEQDMRLTTRLLQLASSSGLGPRRKVSSVRSAVVALGHDAIEQLVLLEEVMTPTKAVTASNLRDHSFLVGGIAAALEPRIADCFVAGVLHDVGHLLCSEQDEPGGRHPLLGSYLAALWGFSALVVEAIRDHHAVHTASEPTLPSVLAFADRVAFLGAAAFDDGATRRLGLDTAERWRRASERFFEKQQAIAARVS